MSLPPLSRHAASVTTRASGAAFPEVASLAYSSGEVSHLPSATSFYLSALEPLGYRFFGAQGDSIALGVREADFFLSQARPGIRPTPTHIAFHADSCLAVRNCFNAALKAGARPSGKPSFRKDDHTCFNAAVEDLNGNTVEYIWRDPAPYHNPNMVDYRTSTYDSSRNRSSSRPLPVRTRTNQSSHSAEPWSSGLTRSHTEPVDGFSTRAMLGTVLGAAAGAAVAYAVVKSERDGGRSEDRYNSMWSRGRVRDHSYSQSGYHRAASLAAEDRTSRGHKSISAAPISHRLLTPTSYADDQQVDYRRQRVSRTSSGRDHVYETVAVGPGHFASRRSVTMPVEQSKSLLLDEQRSQIHSRRGSLADTPRHRHDSVVSNSSYRSYRTAEPIKPPPSQASTVKPSRRSSVRADSAIKVPLPVSRASTKVSARPRGMSQFDAYYLPVDTPNDALRGDQIDDDGLDDTRTIVPDDSISCIDLPRSYASSKARKSERYRSDDRGSRASKKDRSHYSNAR